MKSRWTTYLLLSAVIAVWGVVAWKIFAATDDPVAVAEKRMTAEHAVSPEPDTLFADYPDPFLKGAVKGTSVAAVRVVRSLPAPKSQPVRRERLQAVHLGTVVAEGRKLFIIRIGSEQHELQTGEWAGEFELTGCDGDSLYLSKDGVIYGVGLCD